MKSVKDKNIINEAILGLIYVSFLSLQYSLGVKRDEMRKLEEIAQVRNCIGLIMRQGRGGGGGLSG